MTPTVKITPSIKEIRSKILAVIDNADSRRRVLTRAVLELKDLAAGKPQDGKWNYPPGTRNDNRWYQRRFGSRWKRKDGTTGEINNSQDLRSSWQTEVQRGDDFTAAAFTEVTYAPLLLDDTQRVSWAAGHGWQTLDSIEQEYAPRFEQIVLEELDNQIDKV